MIDIVARRIGSEAQPVVVIDGFHPDPEALRAFALAQHFVPAERHYPGVRAALPGDYLAKVRPAIATVLSDVFECRRSMTLLDASFSMVTTPPAALTLEQRIPHVDAVLPSRIALVHYLTEGDGTAFYRHRATGFETVSEDRALSYFEHLNAELRDAPPAPLYIGDDSSTFERIALIEARPNRAVIYRSALLHSGAIRRDAVLSDDAASGRLTVTAFLAAA